MRAVDAWIEIREPLKNIVQQNAAGAISDEKLYAEVTALLRGARMNRIIDDLVSVANHGCGAAQAMTAKISSLIRSRKRKADPESLKWMMLAEKSGYTPAQASLEILMPYFKPEEIAEARAWVDAWRPSD
ncbi:MAG: hypothetical protein HOJ07_10440 [Rhodospirillaceae bacterium]|jgi:hypothetical protein|nr:hypothetical protein [Rhodospirillaceae bacterium]MBT5676097.1 hypothetical protein [Rhodospirillaceae bacterium]